MTLKRENVSTYSGDVRAQLLRVGTAHVANVLLSRGFRNVIMPGVRVLADDQEKLVGPAYTLRFIPAREDIDTMQNYSSDTNLHRVAIEQCPAESVLVIDANGSLEASSMGDMMAARLSQRGVAGVVTDGGFRDASDIKKTGLPCYQVAPAIPATPIHLHPLSLNEPIGCAGVAVYPGDVIVGDADGVAVIPQHLAAEVAAEAIAAVEYEEYAAQQIAQGRSMLEVFPATTESRAEFDAWVAAGRTEEKRS